MTTILLATIGIAILASLSFIASSVGTSIAGMAAVGAMKKNKGAFGSYLILSAVSGSQGLYGFAGYFILRDYLVPEITGFQAAMILSAGIIMGTTGIISSYMQAKVCANGIVAIGNGHNVLTNTLILAAYPEFFSILGVAVVYLFSIAMGAPGVDPHLTAHAIGQAVQTIVPV